MTNKINCEKYHNDVLHFYKKQNTKILNTKLIMKHDSYDLQGPMYDLYNLIIIYMENNKIGIDIWFRESYINNPHQNPYIKLNNTHDNLHDYLTYLYN